MSPLLWKFLHVLGACLFVGNNLVTPFWRYFAERTRDPRVIAYSQRLITLTDYVFTGGGIALLLSSGHVMAAYRPDLWQTGWFVTAYALFVASGVVWAAVLLPIQIAQIKLARNFAQGGEIPPRYWTLARRWMIAGTLATLLPFGSLFLMITK